MSESLISFSEAITINRLTPLNNRIKSYGCGKIRQLHALEMFNFSYIEGLPKDVPRQFL